MNKYAVSSKHFDNMLYMTCQLYCNMQGKERKAFVQSFFLATQERGYFVLNDTFRYLSDPAKAFAADFAAQDVVSNGSPQQYGAHHEVHLTCRHRKRRKHLSLSHVAKTAQHRREGTCHTCLHVAAIGSQSTDVCRAMATAALGPGHLLLLASPASLNISSPPQHPSLNPLLSSSRPMVTHSMRLRSAQPSALVIARGTLLRSPRLLLPRCVLKCNPCCI